jgi:hypothetical protein
VTKRRRVAVLVGLSLLVWVLLLLVVGILVGRATVHQPPSPQPPPPSPTPLVVVDTDVRAVSAANSWRRSGPG